MNIDKAAFLLLATAIAGGACIIQDGDGDNDDGGAGSGNSGASGGQGGSDGGQGGSDGGQGGSEGGQGGSGGGECNDEIGAPGDCSATVTACSEGIDIGLCNQAIDYFKPAVAEEAVACILALDTAAMCADVYACRNDALANACVDDSTDATCADFAGSCAIDEAECHLFLDGMSQAGRDATILQCGPSAEGCLGGGLWLSLEECVNNLL
jgi:hypothetical protein